MPRRRLISLTNIPTPYRVHFYSALHKGLLERDIHLEVFFMARTEPGRQWRFDVSQFDFPFRIGRGVHPLVGGRQFHFNPSLLASLLISPPDWLLLSGSWYFPTVALSSLISRTTRTRSLFWSESNLVYVEHGSEIATRVRSWVMDRYDAYVVPGQWARDYVMAFAPSSHKKTFLTLPNVVDEAAYRDHVSELKTRREELAQKWQVERASRPILLALARLEPIKGILPFLRVLASDCTKSLTVLIAGDGEQREQVINQAEQMPENIHVRLLGFRGEQEILELLSLVDALILPSLGDPYPLAVIEAIFAGLPLLLSDRVGCHPETLEPGINGFLFNPEDSQSVQTALRSFIDQQTHGWLEMGARSLQIANQRFRTEQVVERFVSGLMQL